VYVRTEDGTHTTLEWIHQDDFWDLFSPAGWSVSTGQKPTYILTRMHGVEDHHDLMTDGGTELITACCGATPVRRYMDSPGCPECDQWGVSIRSVDAGGESA